ncbi:MAG: hypothetical protein IIV01_02020 [Bacteroidaceae bacterium]|jgi:hypothetical protein|nr:hypothetical protein [Bacteroidaceae bacterium]MBQ5654983.1 hypothetical protein [Bacteroidaceae bacterium]
MIKVRTLMAMAMVIVLMSACDLLNCTQADVSLLKIEMYDASGNKVMLPDTLTITTCGTDSVLVNRDLNTTEILLPLSYHAPADTFILRYYGKYYSLQDTLFVEKTNDLYFESPDCPTVMMHTIQGAFCTDEFLSSVEVANKKVNFEEVTHLKLFVQEQ